MFSISFTFRFVRSGNCERKGYMACTVKGYLRISRKYKNSMFVYRLSYVRTVQGHESGVQAVAVSETLGDIASVSHHGKSSIHHLVLASRDPLGFSWECP